MEGTTNVIVFGDQTDDTRSHLQALIRTELDPILESFIDKSYSAIRAELLRPLRVEDKRNWNFSNLLELLDVTTYGSQRVALDHAIATICHFALFFKRCHASRGLYPDAEGTILVGLCVGSLAAAAISCCKSLSELLPVAVKVTILAFQVGEFAAESGARLQSGSSSSELPWAIAIPGLEEKKATALVDAFTKSKGLPCASRPYIGVTSSRGVTVCGPPYVLSDLRADEHFSNLDILALPIHAPYHAPHLFSLDDIESLLHQPMTVGWNNHLQTIPVFSNESVCVSERSTLRDTISQALNSIFIETLDWRKISTVLQSVLQKSTSKNATLVPIASGASQSLYQALKQDPSYTLSLIDLTLPSISKSNSKTLGQYTSRSKIAVVGASGRFPSASDVSKFWDLLLQGLDVHKVVPASRWDARTHVDTSDKPCKNTSATPFGCWLDDAALFDAKFFGMSPREAEQVDPAQRLALMTAYEALEDGGIVPGTRSTQSNRVGVVYGVTSNDWMETNSAQNIDTYMIPGGNRAFIPGRINYFFKFSGPSYAIDTACSSSLAAIHVACNVLWRNEADTMIVGGTNIITNPDFTAGLDRGHFLSRTGNCKTFDDEADGYCRGEGVGTVILKRLEDAILDGDNIKGVIVNTCTNHSAESESITRPHLKAQREIFTKVLDGLSPSHVSYVEMHGTGTQVGDATEMGSVLDSIAPSHGIHLRSETDLVHVGSVKANVGHGEAAAGVTSLIKLLLMMKHDTIVPHCGIKSRINRKFPTDLAARGVRIATEPLQWKRNGKQPRHALLNNFSAAGGNTTLLLQDAPCMEPESSEGCQKTTRPTYPITISSKSFSALQANAKALLQFIQQTNSLDISSVSYTTTARRIHHAHRIAVHGTSLQNLTDNLFTAIQTHVGKSRHPTPSVIFAFTGQGGSYIGTGRDLYLSNTSFKTNIDRYNQIALNQGFSSFLPIIQDFKGDISSFGTTKTQLAILSLQMALAKLWISWGVTPSAVIGHSLGHYAALVTGGVISEADAVFAVGIRAQQLQEGCKPATHRMIAVRAPPFSLTRYLDGTGVEIACINGPQDTILSGVRPAIELLHARLVSDKIRGIMLDIPYAFHSSQVDSVLEHFRAATSGIKFHAPQIPVLCGRTHKIVREGGIFDSDHLVDHFRQSVDFVAAIEAAQNEKLITENTIFVEIGHNSTVTAMLLATLGDTCKAFPSLKKNQNNWSTMTDALKSLYMAGNSIRWDEYHRDFAKKYTVIELPQYKWDLKSYWLQYVNDWSLRKGDAPEIRHIGRPSMLSTTIHSVLREESVNNSGQIVLRSDISRPELHSVAQGHRVNGLPLCTPSIYADIALTVGRYLQETRPAVYEGKQISIDNMTISKALIAQPMGPQYLQTTITISPSSLDSPEVEFSSVDADGSVIITHAHCNISFTIPHSPTDLQTLFAKTTVAISGIQERLREGKCYRFNTNMIYRMVATLADFDRGYRGLKEIVLDNAAMTAASKIDFHSLTPGSKEESFAVHPAYLDSLSQSAGFVMNANEDSDLGVECFVNHGWQSFILYEKLDKELVYESIVQMVNTEGSIWKGTLTVVGDGKLVAVFEGLNLQGVPPRLLHRVLESANKAQSKSKSGRDMLPELHTAFLPVPAPYINRTQMNDAQIDGIHNDILHTDEVPPPTLQPSIEAALNQISAIVADESGIDVVELYDHMEFTDIGIDSLLSLLLTSRLKEDLDFDIGSGYSIFDSFTTLGQLKSAYARSKGLSLTPASVSISEEETATVTPASSASASEASQLLTEQPARPVTSIVMQQSTTAASKVLFLFPDGSGSASSYTSLPPVSQNVTLIGLICPYRHDPAAMTISLTSLIASYITEIRRRQPEGPYSLGGWSSGGIYAYRASQMLLDEGCEVQDLVLMDSPPPNDGLERLPERFYKHCAEVGVFGQIGDGETKVKTARKEPPKWLIPHFNATIDLLSTYHAEPLNSPRRMSMPMVSLCWAGECALDGVRYAKFEYDEGDSEGVRFLSEQRTDFGPGKWAELVQGAEWKVEVIKEWDHFNMMFGEGGKVLSAFIAKALLCN